MRRAKQRSGGGQQREFGAYAERLQPADIRKFLSEYKWHAEYERPAYVRAHGRILESVLEYLAGRIGDPGIDSWLLLAPQLVNPKNRWPEDGQHRFPVRERSRDSETRYSVYTEPDHVTAARFLAGIDPGTMPNVWTKSLLKAHQAVLLFYAVMDPDSEAREPGAVPTIAFALVFPPNGIKEKLRWGVKRPNNEITVPVGDILTASV